VTEPQHLKTFQNEVEKRKNPHSLEESGRHPMASSNKKLLFKTMNSFKSILSELIGMKSMYKITSNLSTLTVQAFLLNI
jgi:hypothetical protein